LKILKRIGRHDALVAIGQREAELQRILDESGSILPLLADKDCGLKRADTNVLAAGGYIRRSWNMLGDAVRLTDKGYSYLAEHRGDEHDAELVAELKELATRIEELRDEWQAIRQTDWISGQLGRAVRAEIHLLEYQAAGLYTQRRRHAGDGR
jgi:hypothetical protein